MIIIPGDQCPPLSAVQEYSAPVIKMCTCTCAIVLQHVHALGDFIHNIYIGVVIFPCTWHIIHAHVPGV